MHIETTRAVLAVTKNGDNHTVVQFYTNEAMSGVDQHVQEIVDRSTARTPRRLESAFHGQWPEDVEGIRSAVLEHDPSQDMWSCSECGVRLPPLAWTPHAAECQRHGT